MNTNKNIILVRGWDCSLQEYKEAWDDGRLLTAQIETSNLCDLMCEYCFREELGLPAKRRLPGEMTITETLQLIDQLADLGTKTINIIGAGEPTLDPGFEEIVHYISQYGIVPVVFTHGGTIDERLVDVLKDTNSSVIIKVNSFHAEVQDALVGRKGYSAKRDRGLKLLLSAGFASPGIDSQGRPYHTCLGIDSVICQENKDDILDIFRYCRMHNIMPLIKTFIPAGRTKERTDMEISLQEYIALARKVQEIDEKEFGIMYDRFVPYLGSVPCTQNGRASIYVTILGDIFECPGQQHRYGNVKTVAVKETFAKIREEEKNFNFGCPPRIEYWRKK
ncbi:MAG: radical SAM protein [Nanoarchaeota archaeon]